MWSPPPHVHTFPFEKKKCTHFDADAIFDFDFFLSISDSSAKRYSLSGHAVRIAVH